MAANKPFGCRPVGATTIGRYGWASSTYFIPSSDTNAYYVNDVVKSLANADVNGIPGVVKITNGTDTPRGIIVGVLPWVYRSASIEGVALNLEQINIPATKTRNYFVQVIDDPDVEFEVQDDGITTANLVAANANKNSSLTIAAPTSGGVSASVLLSSSFATTQGLIIRLKGLAQYDGNVFGAYGIYRAKFNQHELMGNTAGI